MFLKKAVITKVAAFILIINFIFIQTAHGDTKAVLMSKVNTTSKQMALTFDVESGGKSASKILDILKKNNIRCTFFLTGEFAKCNPEIVKRILKEGHEIGNHSYTHPNFKKLSYSQIKNELKLTEKEIIKIANQAPKTFFRPPYGDYNQKVLQTAGALGYNYVVLWSIDPRDWSGIKASEITRRICTNCKPGSIALMHINGGAKHTAESLPATIQKLKRMGYKLETISNLINFRNPQKSTH